MLEGPSKGSSSKIFMWACDIFSFSIVAVYIITLTWMYGLGWALGPLFGWNRFRPVPGDVKRCGVDLGNRNPLYMSYGYSLLAFCFFVPLSMLTFCCCYIQKTLRTMTLRSEGRHKSVVPPEDFLGLSLQSSLNYLFYIA